MCNATDCTVQSSRATETHVLLTRISISTMSDPPSDFLCSDQDRCESEDESVESSISFNSGLLNFDGNVSDSASGDNIGKKI